MKVRLHGTTDEIAGAAERLAKVFDIRDISRIYNDRPPSQLARQYLDIDLSTAHAERSDTWN